MLDATPFVAWFDREAVNQDGQAAVLRLLGWNADAGARKVYRWRNGNRCEDPLGLLDAMHQYGVDFFSVFDAHFRAETATECRWDAGYERIRAQLLDEGEPADETEGAVWRYRVRPGKPTGVYGKMTESEVRSAHLIYVNTGLSLRKLGALLWERFGYKSANSCANSLSQSFKLYGLPARDRIEATISASTRHGLAPRRARASKDPAYREHRAKLRRQSGEIADAPFCAGVRVQYPHKGAPCQNRAMLGSAYCRSHEPTLRDEVVDVLARARQNLGLRSDDLR
jgi:hypothetical protein